MESLIDNCWQFRSRQLLDTDYEVLDVEFVHTNHRNHSFRGNVSSSGKWNSFGFSSRKKERYSSHVVVRDIFFLSSERFLETLHFNLSGGQIKETMVQKSTSRSLIFPSFSSRSSPVFSHLLRRRGSKGNVVNHSKFKIRGRDRDCRGVKKMQSDL